MDVYIEPSVLTDHKLIYISVNLNNINDQDKRIRTGYWKLNNTLLEDKQFLSMAKLTINENWRKAKAMNSFEAQWEFLKYQIRRLATHRGKEMAKDKRIMDDNITKKIIMIYENPDTNQQGREQLITLQLQLDQIYEDKARRAFVRSRRKWMEEGEKNTKYFFNLEIRNAGTSSIIKLDINGQITDDAKEISNFVKNFYENL